MLREIDGGGTDSASDLEYLFAAPAVELGKARDMGLHEIFAGLHFVEIVARAEGLRRMPDVARAPVPVLLHLINNGVLREPCHKFSRPLPRPGPVRCEELRRV